MGVHFTARTDHNWLKSFFSEYQFDLLYSLGKQKQVPDALSRKPRTTKDIQELLCIHNEDDEPIMQVKVPTKKGQYKLVLFALYSKSRAQQKGVKYPEVEEIPAIFNYTQDPDYGKVYQNLTNPPPTPDPSLSLYTIQVGNVIWID